MMIVNVCRWLPVGDESQMCKLFFTSLYKLINLLLHWIHVLENL